MKLETYKKTLNGAKDLILIHGMSKEFIHDFFMKNKVNATTQQIEEFYANVKDEKLMEKHNKWLKEKQELIIIDEQETKLIDKCGFKIICLDCGRTLTLNHYANDVFKMKGITVYPEKESASISCECGNVIHSYWNN